VTGYRLTRFDAAGVTSVVLPPTQVRAVERVRAGGWTVTALTADGEVASAPVWSSVDDTGQPPAVQVSAPQRLQVSWSAAGSLVVSWRNPARDAGRADRWVVTVNGLPVRGNERPGRLPTRAVVAARELPAGDLTVGVTLGSTRDQTDAEAVVARPARFPVSGRAVPAGRARYRVYLQVAPSWARLACRRAACPGTVLRLAVSGRRYTTWVDGEGRATASVTAPSDLRRLTLAVRTADRSRRVLDMPRARRPALTLSVSRGADGVAPAQSRPAAFSAR
jgi:hypothetical protein